MKKKQKFPPEKIEAIRRSRIRKSIKERVRRGNLEAGINPKEWAIVPSSLEEAIDAELARQGLR